MNDWRKAILKQLGYRATPQNLKFLTNWQHWEGGHTNNSASWNWLNTTKDAPGALGSINSVGVKKFKSFQHGVQATVSTLRNGRYQDILDGLASGDPYSSNIGRGLQVWVSGRPDGNPQYAAKVMGGTYKPPPPVQRAAAAAKRIRNKTQQLAQPGGATPGGTAWDTAMKMIFDDDWEMMNIMASMDDETAVKSRIVSKRGTLSPPKVDTPTGGNAGSLLKIAATALGKPYVFGSGPGTDSFDCSDLVQWAYKQIGISIPRVTYDQIKIGRNVKGKKLMPGDLIFPHSGHVVMYVGGGKVIAAPYTGTVVQYQPVPRNPLAVRRIL